MRAREEPKFEADKTTRNPARNRSLEKSRKIVPDLPDDPALSIRGRHGGGGGGDDDDAAHPQMLFAPPVDLFGVRNG